MASHPRRVLRERVALPMPLKLARVLGETARALA
jgi:hypothetical protein